MLRLARRTTRLRLRSLRPAKAFVESSLRAGVEIEGGSTRRRTSLPERNVYHWKPPQIWAFAAVGPGAITQIEFVAGGSFRTIFASAGPANNPTETTVAPTSDASFLNMCNLHVSPRGSGVSSGTHNLGGQRWNCREIGAGRRLPGRFYVRGERARLAGVRL